MTRSAEVVYTEYWVIRVIKDTIVKKEVVQEIKFHTPPTEQDIVNVLVRCASNEFISVEHCYKLGRDREDL